MSEAVLGRYLRIFLVRRSSCILECAGMDGISPSAFLLLVPVWMVSVLAQALSSNMCGSLRYILRPGCAGQAQVE